MAIARIGEFRALAGQEDALAHFLASITPLILGSEGALSCQLFRDRDDAARFLMIEHWETPEAHQASVKNIPPDLLQKARGLFAAAPVGSYFDPID